MFQQTPAETRFQGVILEDTCFRSFPVEPCTTTPPWPGVQNSHERCISDAGWRALVRMARRAPAKKQRLGNW